VDLYKGARKEGVKPLIGCEVYVTDDRRAQQKGQAHLTLLAETNEGYANLIRLSSLGYLEGYYYKPRVDWELLSTHGAGLIALSGCLSGRVCKTPEEMALDFPGLDDAMRRTLEVAARCNVEIELDRILLPRFDTPDGRDAFDYLVELVEAGAAKRYGNVSPEHRERLQFELKTI